MRLASFGTIGGLISAVFSSSSSSLPSFALADFDGTTILEAAGGSEQYQDSTFIYRMLVKIF